MSVPKIVRSTVNVETVYTIFYYLDISVIKRIPYAVGTTILQYSSTFESVRSYLLVVSFSLNINSFYQKPGLCQV